VAGGLTIKGVVREVVLEVEERSRTKDAGGDTIVFRAKTAMNRLDWGLKWSGALEAGGVLVGDKVDIELDIRASTTA
jgi:polyisoprenoid-binding protein YceI